MLKFYLLGSVEVTAGDSALVIDRAQRRAVLAYLLLHANEAVSASQIIDALWGEAAPATARTQVFAAVSTIRGILRKHGGVPIASVPGGYRLTLGEGQLDLAIFQDLLARSREQERQQDLQQAIALARSALELWRGTPLAGITGAFVDASRATLEEQRLGAQERLYELEVGMGRHGDVASELADLVAANPLRERLVGHLMLALYRCGCQAKALTVYRQTRKMLVSELGIEPTAELQLLQKQILDNEPALAAPARPQLTASVRRMRFLPRDVPDFVGRKEHMEELDAIAMAWSDVAGAVVISAIAGAGGVGKTALAVRWAHRRAADFPDGQLYCDLRGYDHRSTIEPIEALQALLRALGVPQEDVPHDADEASALFRAKLSGRKALVLLDNVRSAEQVRPLLPATPGSLVLVTSRDTLAGLVARDGARRITLGVLEGGEAIDLLSSIVGMERIDAESAAAQALAKECGFLPLALRIAAAHLVEKPELSIAAYVDGLRNGDRIVALAVPEDATSSLRAIFHYSYLALSELARRPFRLLGLAPGSDFTRHVASALADIPLDEGSVVLDELLNAHLVHETAVDHFAMHDLVREYARWLCGAADPVAERNEAMSRCLGWYAAAAAAAEQPLRRFEIGVSLDLPQPRIPVPDFPDADAALAWFDLEAGNLIAAVKAASARHQHAYTVQLAHLLQLYLTKRGLVSEWVTTFELAECSAASLDNDSMARTMLDLGFAYEHLGRTDAALRKYEQAVSIFRSFRDRHGEATALNRLGGIDRRLGRHDHAARHYKAALDIFREVGDETREASTQSNLSVDLHLLGRQGEALVNAHEALELQTRLGGSGIAGIRTNLGRIYARLHRHAEAVEHTSVALELHRKHGSINGAALALANLCFSYARIGRIDDAVAAGNQAVTESERTGYVETQVAALNSLGEACWLAGDNAAALDRHRQALELANQIGDADERQRAEKGIAAAEQAGSKE